MSERHGTLLVDTSFLGDVLGAEPLVRAAAAQWPEDPVDFLAGPGGVQMLAGHPQLRELAVFDKRGVDQGFGGLCRVARRLREKRYARAICSHRSWRTAALLRLTGIPVRVGFHNASAAWLYSQRVRYRKDLHEVERNLELIGGGGWEAPRMYPGEAERARAQELLEQLPQPPVALAPGSIWATKRWPPRKWSELLFGLCQSGQSVVLLGGPDDAELCEEIRMAAGLDAIPDAACLDLSGQTSLRESAAVLESCTTLVSNDSAPMHLGVAAGIPVVAVYCSTVPAFGFAPRGPRDLALEVKDLACRPCGAHGRNECPEKHFRCGEDLGSAQVLRAALERSAVSV
ncbi:MAG: glycosyltransferase family 9 protein [Planctomycetes bacterium]|nr:glycosyltransferase family 9 protein [Planctomycetota bacterium]